MADDLIVTDEAIEDSTGKVNLVLKRLLSDIIERLSNTVLEIADPIQTKQIITIIGDTALPIDGLTGQVLTKQSNLDQDADWATPSGASGEWVKISDTTPLVAATIDIIWDETAYSAIRIILENIQPVINNANMNMQFGHTNGTVIIVSQYAGINQLYSGTTWNNPSSTLPRLANTIGNDASDKGVYGIIDVFGFGSNSQGAMANIFLNWEDGTPTAQGKQTHIFVGGQDSIIDTFQLLLTSGNFQAVGNVKVYGLKI